MPTKNVILSDHIVSILEDTVFQSALIAAINDWKKVISAIEPAPSPKGREYDVKYLENLNLHGIRNAADSALIDTVIQLVGATCERRTVTIETEAEDAQ